MRKRKILIVDSDIIARRAITKVLQRKTNHQLIVKSDLELAEKFIVDYNPDLLLLGIRASVVEEIAMLSTIRVRFPNLPVVILSERTEEGGAIAIAGLRLGVVDFITKPEHYNSLLFAENHLLKRVIPIVRTSLDLNMEEFNTRNRGQQRLQGIHRREKGKIKLDSFWPLSMVVIGGCTGGVATLMNLISRLPENFSTPILIVQHLPKMYTKVLARRLNEISRLKVKQAEDGVVLTGGSVWIAPGGYHFHPQKEGNKTYLRVHRGPRENGERPSIDILFRSAGQLYGPGVLGIILSGSGTDGVAGAGVIQQGGGQIIVQEPETCLAPELPLSVMRAGFGDASYTVDEMVEQLTILDHNGELYQSEQEKKSGHVVRYMSIRHFDKHLFSTIN